jgi:thiamine biosynthesis lipoprotein
MRRGFAAALALSAGCILPPGGPPARFEYVESHMGTPCRVKFYAESPEAAGRAKAAAYAELAAVDAAMSDYKPESELSRLNAAAGKGPVPVSPPLYEVLWSAQVHAELSDGAFDVTVGPVVRLWRQARRERALPGPDARRAALDLVGHRKLRLDPAARTAALEKGGMLLDLGGIAKGFACDRALAALKRMGIGRAMVDAGGGMAIGDPPPGQKGWRIQVADETSKVLVLSNCGVATSGDWDQYVEIDGVRYSHIVDPKTGTGLTHRAIVTVVAPDGMIADALSTALSVMGPERGVRLAEDLPGTEAYLRWREGDRLRAARTSGFTGLLEP